jgi:hypothetical protein
MRFTTPALVAPIGAGAAGGARSHARMVVRTQIRHFCFSNSDLQGGSAGSGPPVAPRSALVTTPSQFGAKQRCG